MVPGSSVALRGQGSLGFNLGIGLPIVMGTISDYVTLSARISAGARVSMSGVLDVQLVRGEGKEVFVDVGLSKQQVKHFSLAVDTGWGVEGLPIVDLDLGPVHVDLTKIAERALEKQLNKKLAVFSATASTGSQEGRLTVARFSFDLGKGDVVVSEAMAQALHGDIRLAQALANRPRSGVEQHLDLAKDFRSESDYLGFRFLSLRFFTSTGLETGTVSVDADGRHQTLLFNELRRESGSFFTEHKTVWRQVTSLVASKGELVDASVNARLTIREQDGYLTKDQILDHADPLVAYFMGFDATFNKLGEITDRLSLYADYACDTPDMTGSNAFDQLDAYTECARTITETPEHRSLRNQALNSYADLADGMSLRGFVPEMSSVAEISQKLFEMKTGISGVHERPDGSIAGPDGALVAQFRLSHEALEQMMSSDGAARFGKAIEDVLSLMHADREADMDVKQAELDKSVGGRARDIRRAVDVFARAADQYGRFKRVTELKFKGERLGDHASVMLVPVSNPDDVRLATLAEHKGEVLQDLFEALDNLPDEYGKPVGYVCSYAMLWLTQPENVEFLADFQLSDNTDVGYEAWTTRVYGRGTDSFIGAGIFALDELLGAH